MRIEIIVAPRTRIKVGACIALLASLCMQAFASADDAARYSAGRGERALLVWQDGRLQMERYRAGGSRAKTEHVYSITKSLCALGTFAAISRNVLKLDEPVSLTLTEWRNDPRKRRITVRDLLNQTSGLSPGFGEIYSTSLRNKEKAALKLPVVSTPGETFAYGPSHYEALEALMARKLERSPLIWIDRALFGPLGIKPGRLETRSARQSLFFRRRTTFRPRSSGRRTGGATRGLESDLLARCLLLDSHRIDRVFSESHVRPWFLAEPSGAGKVTSSNVTSKRPFRPDDPHGHVRACQRMRLPT